MYKPTMPRVQMELLFDSGIKNADEARQFLTRSIRAYGEFHDRGRACHEGCGEAQSVLRACRTLRRSEVNQKAYAAFYIEEDKARREVT